MMDYWRVVYKLRRASAIRSIMLPEYYETREEAEIAADELREGGFHAGVLHRQTFPRRRRDPSGAFDPEDR
jgi:hypothetical protein